ncbi:MAG: DUF222 domain-containing protein [Myxococcales bacterium]|nr:MAG: DUF222 domain-containing protein [Myxococcales bacterium]
MKRVEDIDQIGEEIGLLAAQISLATHRLLLLIRAFDEGGGPRKQGALSCAHWLSWRVGMSLGAAREHVRVAHALAELPTVDAQMREGKLSYSKVRAITRIATPANEARLVALALDSSASQLEKICRQYRKLQNLEEATEQGKMERYLRHWETDEGMVRFEVQLPKEEALVVLKALQAAQSEARETESDVSAETSEKRSGKISAETPEPEAAPSPASATDQSDALLMMAESFLAHGTASRPSAEQTQLYVHLKKDVLSEEDGWSARLEDGSRLAPETFRRLCCDSSLVAVKEDKHGNVLDIGRKARTIPPAISRALRLRDQGCKFPGCTHTKFLHAHHVKHWAHGGETKLDNLILLCTKHHRAVHEDGFTLSKQQNSWSFHTPDGTALLGAPTFPRERLRLVKSLPMPAPEHAETLMTEHYQHQPDYVTAVASI